MSALRYCPHTKEEVGWTEKETLLKEEKEEDAVAVKIEVEDEAVTVKEEETVKIEVEDEAVTVKEEEVTVKEEEESLRVKEGMKEEGEITVTLEETGDLINTSKCCFKNSGTNSVVILTIELMCSVKDCRQVLRASTPALLAVWGFMLGFCTAL